MPALAPYLNFNGDCEAAFNFYKAAFGGEFVTFQRFGEMPPQEGTPPMPEHLGKLVLHVALPIGNGGILMGSDTAQEFGGTVTMGTNVHISIDVQSRDEADRLATALSEGGTVTMPLADTFWGAYFGMWQDKFGVNWMINYDQK